MSDRLASSTFDEGGVRRKVVADDMRSIFGEKSSASWRARRPIAGGAMAPSPRKTSLRRYALPAIGAVAVIGTAAGLIVTYPLHNVRHGATAERPRPVAARAMPRALPAPAPSAMVAQIESVSPPPSRPAAIEAGRRPALTSLAKGAAAYRSAPPPPMSDDACEPLAGYAYARCRRADVLAADRSLRVAYDRAIDAGVDRRRLVSIRNNWAALRNEEYDRPDALLDGYARLEDRLDRAARDADDDLN